MFADDKASRFCKKDNFSFASVSVVRLRRPFAGGVSADDVGL